MIRDDKLPVSPTADVQRLNPHLYGPPPEARKLASLLESERQLHTQIMDWLHMKGVKGIVRARMDRKSTLPTGVPDMLFAVKGVPVAIEAKVGNNSATSEQIAWLADLSSDGWVTGVVRSLDDAIKIYELALRKLELQSD